MYFRSQDPAYAELHSHVSDVLSRLGIPHTLAGYQYLCRMICIAYESPDKAELITKDLYPRIGKEFHCHAVAVDRACRRALEQAYRLPYIYRSDGYYSRMGPCAFITLTAVKLRRGEL